MTVPLVDLREQYRAIQHEVDSAVRAVLESGNFILGPQVAAFEREAAAYLGVAHAVGVASGTDALVLALRALGVGPGDEVICPSFTFFATAEAVSMVGGTPVFVDVYPDTLCIDVGQVAERITPRTRAVIPVHIYGHPADMDPLLALARERGITVVEDNAQAFGAAYRGRRTGAMGDVGCISFFPTKNLGAYGDGGMVVTNDPAVAQAVAELRTHGWAVKYRPKTLGYNSRLDELQAAVLRVKLRHVDAWNEQRRGIARQYRERLDPRLRVPTEAPGARHVYHLYVLRVAEREAVQARLNAAGVASGAYYPFPVHRLMPYAALEYADGALPVTDAASNDNLAIPLYPEMTETQVEAVARAVNAAALPEAAGVRS